MKKAVTPVIALTLIILTLIVVLGVLNFWFVQIQKEEFLEETFEVEIDCGDQIIVENYGFPHGIGPVIITSGEEEQITERHVRNIVINCK